jgi:acylphosphatase
MPAAPDFGRIKEARRMAQQAKNPVDESLSTHALRIRGRVQGVGFRWSLCEQARALGLAGWVRNRRDGSVEALIHGPAGSVAALVEWAHRGPPGAHVTALEMHAAEADTSPTGFEQLPTA